MVSKTPSRLKDSDMKYPRLACLPALLSIISCMFITACGDDTSQSQTTEIQTTAGQPTVRAAPRFDDGMIRLDQAPGENGYWGNPSVSSLAEAGIVVPMNKNGRLENIQDAAMVAPFQPWALALYKYRQENGLKDDPVRACISPAGPRHLMDKGGFKVIQDRNYNRIYLLFGGGNRNWRVIYMDGREPPNPEEVVGTFYGHSTGHWEGDTLVVEASGFNTRFWFSNGGLPHTEALKTTERFTRTDYHTLRYEVTINDPRTYTRPWNSKWTLEWVEGDIKENFCEE